MLGVYCLYINCKSGLNRKVPSFNTFVYDAFIVMQEFQKLLSTRSVAYLNMDVTVRGNYSLVMDALPNMNKLLYQSAKLIENPDEDEVAEGRTQLYDTWAKRQPKNSENTDSIPRYSSHTCRSVRIYF